MTQTITFVTPRYGADVHGGAEQAARLLATGLAAEDWKVRVLTTCARSHVTWADHFEPATTTEEGVEVTRVRVDRPRDRRFDELSDELLPRAASIDDAAASDWIDRQGPDSRELLDAIAAVSDGVLAFTPYLYQPTVKGLPRAQVPTVLHAAAHPELALGLSILDPVFGQADALSHFSRSEQDLVLERFPDARSKPQTVLGLPVEASGPVDPDRTRHDLSLGDEPFVLALGRIDKGKGVHDLVARWDRLRRMRGSGTLVLAGPVVDAPPDVEGVVCLGPVSEDHKLGLLAAADVLINPSPHESFSIVVPEAFLMGTPALVNGWCGPLREHCENSSGGLWYTGIADFDAALTRLLDDADLRSRLGENGRRYVESFFAWPAVRDRYVRLLAQLN